MIDGVEILNTIESQYNIGDIIFALGVSIVLLGFIVLLIYAIVNKENLDIFFISMAIVILLGCAFFFIATIKTSTRYEVIISDDVKFTEFNDKYKIIEQNGEIYTIEERE